MDPLEQFIRDNKEELKHKLENKDALWDAINKDITPRKQAVVKRLGWQKWAIAASFLLAVGVGMLWLNNGSTDSNMVAEKPLEILEIDAHYQKLINARVMQVKNSTSLSQQQKTEIIKYLQNLENESLELEKELEININNVQIIQAIINNYRERLDIMEKLLDRSIDQNNNKHERNISI